MKSKVTDASNTSQAQLLRHNGIYHFSNSQNLHLGIPYFCSTLFIKAVFETDLKILMNLWNFFITSSSGQG